MKVTNLLPLAALSNALVFPPEQVLGDLAIEDHHSHGWEKGIANTKDAVFASFEEIKQAAGDEALATQDDIASDITDFLEDTSKQAQDAWTHFTEGAKSALHDAMKEIGDGVEEMEDYLQENTPEFDSWIDSEGSFEMFTGPHPPPPPHHPPPHHPPPGHGPPHHPPPGERPPHHPPPGHGPPDHHKPHHPKHPHKFNLTVYELIAKSNYTTKLAKLINKYPDLVDALNGTKANYTIFAPTDKAFEKIPSGHEPSKEVLLAILKHHVVPDWYPAFRVLTSHTAPTLLDSEYLGDGNTQRLAFKLGLRGLTVDFFSRIIAVNIFGTNGVVHGVDHIILPPPSELTIVSLFPGTFSTLELGLFKSGLYDELNNTKHAGSTLFAPSNLAFEKLGPKINAFLFSKYGEKFLKALLQYHIAPGNVLYSDALYKTSDSDAKAESFPKGHYHVDLPTLLKDRSLAVDVARFGGFITVKINAYVTVRYQDVIAKDGVIHVIPNVLVPPKKLGGSEVAWDESDLTVENFVHHLEPFVTKSDL